MNDQLMDASNKGLLIDLMQYWLAMPAWWITRMLILFHEACAVVLSAVMVGALPNATGFPGWVGPLTSALMGTWYSSAVAIGMLGLGLTLMLMGSGFRLKLVQPRAFVRWSLIMVLLAMAAPSLYATTMQLVTQAPAVLMPPIVAHLPPITASWIAVRTDETVVAPFDPANEAYAARAAVLAVPATASGCATHITSSAVCEHPMYTPMDAVLALWRTDRTSLISGVDGVHQTTPDGTITVQFDGLPPDFAALFYPDSTQPWYGGSFTSDPSGMQKRREALNTASSGTLHAVVGILAALATLMPTLAQALMTVCGALLFLLGIVVAPLGMLGNQRQWVAVVYRSFFQISGWQTVLAVGTNLATYLLFGTPTQLGIAMAYPTMLVVLPLFVWVQWRVLRFAMSLSWQGFAAVRTVVSREPLQRLLGDQPAAATEARVTATGHYTATADPAATQPTMAPSTLLRTTPMLESSAPSSAAHAPSSALPSLINPRGMVMRMQQATQRTVQRVQQLDHQIEVKEARMLRTAEVRTDTQLDRADQAITTMIGGKAIAAGVTYVHENEVTPEWLFAPPPASTSARSTTHAPRAGQPSSTTAPVARRDGDRSRLSSTAPRPSDTPTQELPTRPMPRTARPHAADLPPTQPLVASADRPAMPTAATEATALDTPRELNTAHAAIASVAHAPTPAPASHVTASTPPSAPARSTGMHVPTPPTQELPAAAPIRGSVAPSPARQQPVAHAAAPHTPALVSSAPRGPQRPPTPASVPTNEAGLVSSAAMPPSDPALPPTQPDAPRGQATPVVATATRAPMDEPAAPTVEPAAPTVEARTPQATTRPARSRSRSRVGMPAQGHATPPIIDITKEGQPAQSDPSPPAAAPLIPPRSEQRGRR